MTDVTPIPKPLRRSLEERQAELRRKARERERRWWQRSVERAKSRRRKPLPVESAKRRAERPLRAAVIEATHERSGWRCEAADLVLEVACSGPLDCDERVSRGVSPSAHLDLSVTQSLCRAHHEWRHAHPYQAQQLGLRGGAADRRPVDPGGWPVEDGDS